MSVSWSRRNSGAFYCSLFQVSDIDRNVVLPDFAQASEVLLGCLRSLGLYRHPDSGQLIRVNYAALNVE